MTRIWAIIAFIDVAFMIFTFIDVLVTQPWRIRGGVPKFVWAILVLIISPIGGIIWWFFGKEPIEKSEPPRTVSPDDDPEFLARLRVKEEQDERIARLEKELAELDDDPPKE